MIRYVIVPKGSVRKLLQLMDTFNNVAGPKTNTHQPLFLSAYQQQALWEWNKESNPNYDDIKEKNLRINLIKEVKDSYNKNFNPLKKEIEKDIRRCKDFLCLWINRNNAAKSYQNQSMDSIQSPSVILNFIWKQIGQTSLQPPPTCVFCQLEGVAIFSSYSPTIKSFDKITLS